MEVFLIMADQVIGTGIESVHRLDLFACPMCQSGPVRAIQYEPLNGFAETGDVAFLGQGARLAFDDEFRNAAMMRADYGSANGHGLFKRIDWSILSTNCAGHGRRQKDVGLTYQARNFRVIASAMEIYGIGDT